ncbi:hypothetical protein [Winogradskyella sp. UBA3174]|uniref:hypothetical protein n=1 Tax=Winogradskyella sp. UBA3174 TaxID=1947785 RepID=UPI0025DFFFFB|nr:hypothetical protein [Winogradskyella sp. UBA3174]|tara:strand:+ start:52076 stop:53128 length:1053 start_codon:yes stop_codon:yes gene_type:complete
MSDKLPQDSQNEEVDLGQLFNAIGRLFEKLFSFVEKLFKGLFSFIIYALKPIVTYFKVIAIVLMVSAILGFIAEKYEKPVYSSSMLVKPYFGSKYQLANNVNYFNALIGSGNLKELSTVFEIDTIKAAEILGFEIEIGPETGNDLLKEYNDYIKTIDSTLTKDIPYEDYIENRDILSGTIFSIKAKSETNDIFISLEKGFDKTLKNKYSTKLKGIRDGSIDIRTKSLKNELRKIDSLQNIYLEVLKNESEKDKVSIGLEGMFPLTKEKTLTREYDLFKEQMAISDSLKVLEQELIKYNDYYDILSGFEEVGTIEKNIWDKYSLIFPFVTMLIILFIYLIYNAFKYVKNYE